MKNLLGILLSLFVLLVFSSCKKEEEPTIRHVEQTLFMYLPWSTNLSFSLDKNVSDMEAAFMEYGTEKQRIIVYFANSSDDATLFEIVKENGTFAKNTLKTYSFKNNEYTTVDGLVSIFADVKHFSPSDKYSLLVGCHGLGWINAANSRRMGPMRKMPVHWEGKILTRYFGGLSYDSKTDITTLRQAIDKSGIKLDYILFDNCYMSNVEVAYELRNSADYILASTSEIVSMGMPYRVIGRYLWGNYDFKAVCDGAYEFYSTSSLPYLTFSVIDCHQMETLADLMKRINTEFTIGEAALGKVQILDGYNPSIFYDFGDYVRNLCTDETLLKTFEQQLDKTVVYTVCTPFLYSGVNGESKFPVRTSSGITISDPSSHEWTAGKQNTSWYIRTH